MTAPTPREMAQALAARRRRATFACTVCGREYEAWDRQRQQARTCSPACRQKLYRERKRADLHAKLYAARALTK